MSTNNIIAVFEVRGETIEVSKVVDQANNSITGKASVRNGSNHSHAVRSVLWREGDTIRFSDEIPVGDLDRGTTRDLIPASKHRSRGEDWFDDRYQALKRRIKELGGTQVYPVYAK